MRAFLSCIAVLAVLFIPIAQAHADEPSPMHKTPKPEYVFAEGPALTDTDILLTWFKANTGAYVRLPVAIEFTTEGLRNVSRAWIAASTDDPAKDAIFLDLDDTTLGVGLDDRLHGLCVEQARCVIWIEGRWGQSMPAFGPEKPTPPYPFTVRDTEALKDAPAWLLFSK